MVLVALRGVVGVFPTPFERILTDTRAQPSAFAVHDTHTHARGPEIGAGNQSHQTRAPLLRKSIPRSPARPSWPPSRPARSARDRRPVRRRPECDWIGA